MNILNKIPEYKSLTAYLMTIILICAISPRIEYSATIQTFVQHISYPLHLIWGKMIFWVENLPQSISLALTGWVLFVIMMVKAYRYQNNENFKPDPTWIRGFGRMYVVALLTGIYLTLIAPVITSSNQSTEFLFKSVIFQIMGGPLVLFLIFYLAHRINPFWFIIRFMSLVLVLTGLVVLIDQFVLLPLQR